MIQPLRTQHRFTFVILAVILPVVFVGALVSRPRPVGGTISILVASNGAESKKHLFRTSTTLGTDGTSAVRVNAYGALLAPDILVYYADKAPQQDAVPATARLLGEYNPLSTYLLPEPTDGFLVLYSPAQKSVIDFASLGGR